MAQKRIHESPAARTRAYRTRQRESGLQRIEICLPAATIGPFERLRRDFGGVSVGRLIEIVVMRLSDTWAHIDAVTEDVDTDLFGPGDVTGVGWSEDGDCDR